MLGSEHGGWLKRWALGGCEGPALDETPSRLVKGNVSGGLLGIRNIFLAEECSISQEPKTKEDGEAGEVTGSSLFPRSP